MFGYFLTKHICMLVGVLYPAWKSFKSLKINDETVKLEELVFWTKYWATWSLFTCGEFYADAIVSWLPFYYEVKILIVLWLVYGRGGEILFNAQVAPKFAHYEPEVDKALGELKSRFGRALLAYAKVTLSWVQQRFMQTFFENQTRSLLNQPPVDLFGRPIVDDSADLRNTSQANILQFLSKQPSVSDGRAASSKDLSRDLRAPSKAESSEGSTVAPTPTPADAAVASAPPAAVRPAAGAAVSASAAASSSAARVDQAPAAAVRAASASSLPPQGTRAESKAPSADAPVNPAQTTAPVASEPRPTLSTVPSSKATSQQPVSSSSKPDYLNRIDSLAAVSLGSQESGEAKPRTASEFRAALQSRIASTTGSLRSGDVGVSATQPAAAAAADDASGITLRSAVAKAKPKKPADASQPATAAVAAVPSSAATSSSRPLANLPRNTPAAAASSARKAGTWH